jgi:hypothetical protein
VLEHSLAVRRLRRDELLVTGVDYAFEMRDTVTPGPVALGFHNGGKVAHEMGVVRLKAGASLAQVLAAERAGGDVESFFDGTVGILLARPGDTAGGRLLVNLESGRTYAVWCNFQDAPDQPPHVKLGMVHSLRVP